MSTKNSWTPVFRTMDLLIAEIRHLRAVGAHFRIVYRFRMPGSRGRLAGQEVYSIFLVYRGREYQLRLSLAQRLLFDYLANHRGLAQSARQIELGIRADDFYMLHATNASGRAALTRQIPRSSIREHVKRLHRALGLVFQEAGVAIDPRNVLMVMATAGNEVGYKLKATCTRTYIDLTSPDFQPLL